MSAKRLIAISSTVCSGLLLAACPDNAPVVHSVNTLCVSTDRHYATPAQKAAFAADEGTWDTLVRWMAGFNKVRDAECLKPAAGN